MRFTLSAIVLPLALFGPTAAHARDWVLATDYWGNKRYETIDLSQDGDRLVVHRGSDAGSGTVKKGHATFTLQGRTYDATLQGDRMTGTVKLADENDDNRMIERSFTAWQVPERPAGAARIVDFTPTNWSNLFSADRAPVATLFPGDQVRTKTLDSGGLDDKGVARALYGNPQVGPFFIAGAEPGDTLVVKLVRIRLNRPFADSRDQIVPRAMPASLAGEAASINKFLRWDLDLAAGTGTPQNASGALAGYKVKLRTMLGGLAVAPGQGSPAISTGDTGKFGGNIDFNEVAEGNIVYLPVQQPGALLYFGDGHALQGDGETTQWALETSLDVQIQVDLIKGKAIQMPLVESPTEVMAVGQAGSLDEAVRAATDGLIQWIRRDHGLTLSQAAQVLGTNARYSIVTLAGRNAGVAARLRKDTLPGSR